MPTTPYWETWKNQTSSHVMNNPDGSVYCDDTTSVGRIFSSRLSYSKGAYVLHMLRWVTGDSAFFAGIKNYLNDPLLSYGYAYTSDLKAHLEASSGLNLTEFFDDWYYGQGYPTYSVTTHQNIPDSISITLDQTTSHSSVNFFEMPVPIRLKGANIDTIVVLDNSFSGEQFNIAVNSFIDTVEFDPEIWLVSMHNISTNIGIYQPGDKANIRIMPNPTRETSIIYSDDEIIEIGVYDLSGRKINTYNNINNQEFILNLSNYVTGIYLLRIKTNEQIFLRKIVKD
jgi:hypothetical protein